MEGMHLISQVETNIDGKLKHVGRQCNLLVFKSDKTCLISDEGVMSLGNNLIQVEINGGRITDTTMQFFSTCKRLKKIILRCDTSDVTDAGFEYLKNLELEVLHLNKVAATNAGLSYIRANDIKLNGNFSGRGLLKIIHENLEQLDITGGSFRQEVLDSLACLDHLKKLYLGVCYPTNIQLNIKDLRLETPTYIITNEKIEKLTNFSKKNIKDDLILKEWSLWEKPQRSLGGSLFHQRYEGEIIPPKHATELFVLKSPEIPIKYIISNDGESAICNMYKQILTEKFSLIRLVELTNVEMCMDFIKHISHLDDDVIQTLKMADHHLSKKHLLDRLDVESINELLKSDTMFAGAAHYYIKSKDYNYTNCDIDIPLRYFQHIDHEGQIIVGWNFNGLSSLWMMEIMHRLQGKTFNMKALLYYYLDSYPHHPKIHMQDFNEFMYREEDIMKHHQDIICDLEEKTQNYVDIHNKIDEIQYMKKLDDYIQLLKKLKGVDRMIAIKLMKSIKNPMKYFEVSVDSPLQDRLHAQMLGDLFEWTPAHQTHVNFLCKKRIDSPPKRCFITHCKNTITGKECVITSYDTLTNKPYFSEVDIIAELDTPQECMGFIKKYIPNVDTDKKKFDKFIRHITKLLKTTDEYVEPSKNLNPCDNAILMRLEIFVKKFEGETMSTKKLYIAFLKYMIHLDDRLANHLTYDLMIKCLYKLDYIKKKNTWNIVSVSF